MKPRHQRVAPAVKHAVFDVSNDRERPAGLESATTLHFSYSHTNGYENQAVVSFTTVLAFQRVALYLESLLIVAVSMAPGQYSAAGFFCPYMCVYRLHLPRIFAIL